MSVFGHSAVKDRILIEFLSRPGTKAHVREVARRIHASPPAVGAALSNLASLGILQSETVGRSLVYSVNERSTLLPDIRSLVQKTLGVEARIASALEGLPGVDSAYIFGSYAAGTDRAQSDIDLLIVGRPDRIALSERITAVERALGRDINVVAKTEAQLRARKTSDTFWRRVLTQPLVHVAGREIAF